MKVSYIIPPFTDSTYLVRCINSLYRQLGEDFEVILAENDFGEQQEEIEEFLDSKPQVLRIPGLEFPALDEEEAGETGGNAEEERIEEQLDELETQEEIVKLTASEKLAQAISLISPDSDYLMLIDVTSVVSPVCTKTVLKCEACDLIIPAAAVKKGDEFALDCPETSGLQKNFDIYIPQRFCFGKELFSEFKAEFIENNELFSIFLLAALINGINIVTTEDIVVYVQSFAVPKIKENLNFDTIKEQCDDIFSKLPEIDDAEARVTIFEKVIRNVFDLLSNNENENRQKAYEVLQGYCKKIQDDFLLKRIFEGMVGFESDEFLSLNYGQFIIYKTHVKGVLKPVTAIDCAVQNKLLKDMKEVIDSNKRALEATQKSLTDMKKDVSAIKAKPFTVAVPAATGMVISDPYIDIPKMYREGRLGFKTIWRSFWSWFRFKFSKKKK